MALRLMRERSCLREGSSLHPQIFFLPLPEKSNEFDLQMKALLSAAVTFGLAVSAHAGMFGPPPFTNGSPLSTGSTGKYQATARGPGISGIFKFEYGPNGSQVVGPDSEYIFFFRGMVLTGNTQVSIQRNRIAGVFTEPFGINTNPLYFASQGAGGFFRAKMDINSPSATFRGKGTYELLLWPYVESGGVLIPSPNRYESHVKNFKVRGMRTFVQ